MIRTTTGYSLIEVLTVLGFIVIMGLLLLPSLGSRRSGVELDLTTRGVASLLREAQSRAAIQASSSAWGVHIDNDANAPFFALFADAYSTSTVTERKLLPKGIRFGTALLPIGSSTNILFLEGTGRPAAPGGATVTLEFVGGGQTGTVTSTSISVTSVGTITF